MGLREMGSQVANGLPMIRRAAVRSNITFVLHLFVLTAFAVAQPVYDRVGERPAFLSDMGVEPAAIVLFAITFSVILPSVLAGMIWGVGRLLPRVRAPFHVVVVYLLVTVAVAPLVNRLLFLPHWLVIGLTAGTGAAGAWSYFKFNSIRSVATVAAPSIIVFPAMFLLTSPVARHFFHSAQTIESSRWNPIPVVVIVLDELCGLTLVDENRQIDTQRFPYFAELASISTWFRNTTTVYPDTWQAVPAILSSRYPSHTWPPSVADRPQNLFSILDSTGAYELTAFEPVSRLATTKGKYAASQNSNAIGQVISIMPAVGRVLLYQVTPEHLRSQLPQVPRLWFGFHETSVVDPAERRGVMRYANGEDRLGQFDHFLECLDDSSQPQLYFFHVLLPHIPWCYLPSGRKCIAESSNWELLDDALIDDELYVEQCQQRHLLQLAFIDSQIGRLLDRLRKTGLFDRCLLVVTADHGISFKVGEPRRAVTEANRPEIMSIPLFIKVPGQKSGAISDRNVESIDILPTITDLLGIELQLPIDGQSVSDDAARERPEKTLYTGLTLGGAPIRVPPTILSNSSARQELRRRFGDSNDPDGLFRIGPHSELVGRRVADLSAGADSPVEIALSRAGSVYTQDRAALVPCYFEGRIVAPKEYRTPVELAIAVNGIIRATTRTYRIEGYRDRFAAMISEAALNEGPNDVAYYAITGSVSDLRLKRCDVKSANSK
jgi:hypothetical protein